MIWVQFLVSAGLVVVAAERLAAYGDVIAVRTRLGGLFVGTLLLAAATSLPELLTTINSIEQNVPDMAAGNIFGSCMFNMFMLAVLDLVVLRGRILRIVMLNHAISGSLAVLLAAMAIFFIIADINVGIGWVGIDSLLLIAFYIGGVWLLNNNNVAVEPDLSSGRSCRYPQTLGRLVGLRRRDGSAHLCHALPRPQFGRHCRGPGREHRLCGRCPGGRGHVIA